MKSAQIDPQLKSMRSAAVRLRIYNAIIGLISPGLLVKKWLKYRRFSHQYEWDRSRWSIPTGDANDHNSGLRIVFVALGWAEIILIDKISRELEKERPDLSIVWAVRDVEARQMARDSFPGREIVPMPFDFAIPQRNFINKLRPDALIIIEKFWWPNLVWGAKLAGAKVILVNGRSRGREKARYKFLSGFQRWVLSAFDVLLFESEEQVERVRQVLPPTAQAIATGNLKWSFTRPSPPTKLRDLEAWLENRKSDESGPLPLIFAGSTASADDEWCLESWQKVREQMPCVLAIAPRRVNRAPELAGWLSERGFKVSLRSAPKPGCEILILDTMGELAYAYRYAIAAYVGGAIEGRGHNIIEPLSWGIPVAYGPQRGDFEAAQKAAETAEVGFRVRSAAELAEFWSNCQNKEALQSISERAEALLQTQDAAFDSTMEQLILALSE